MIAGSALMMIHNDYASVVISSTVWATLASSPDSLHLPRLTSPPLTSQIICNCHNFEQNQAEQQLTDEDTIRFLQENDSTLSQLLDASDSVMTDTSKGC